MKKILDSPETVGRIARGAARSCGLRQINDVDDCAQYVLLRWCEAGCPADGFNARQRAADYARGLRRQNKRFISTSKINDFFDGEDKNEAIRF